MMTQEEAAAILVESFSRLDDEGIDNFAWHLKMETPVFCGEELVRDAYFYLSVG